MLQNGEWRRGNWQRQSRLDDSERMLFLTRVCGCKVAEGLGVGIVKTWLASPRKQRRNLLKGG
jgi:hypothetical protein